MKANVMISLKSGIKIPGIMKEGEFYMLNGISIYRSSVLAWKNLQAIPAGINKSGLEAKREKLIRAKHKANTRKDRVRLQMAIEQIEQDIHMQMEGG